MRHREASLQELGITPEEANLPKGHRFVGLPPIDPRHIERELADLFPDPAPKTDGKASGKRRPAQA